MLFLSCDLTTSLCSLSSHSIPKVKVIESGKVGEYELELTDDPDDLMTISVAKVPIYVSFATIGKFAVIDPSMEEEMCHGCRVTFGVNASGNVVGLEQGAGALGLDLLPELTIAATKVGSQLISQQDALLESEGEGKTQKIGFSKRSTVF